MTKTTYRRLLSIILMTALIALIFCCFLSMKEEKKITEGTLVQNKTDMIQMDCETDKCPWT